MLIVECKSGEHSHIINQWKLFSMTGLLHIINQWKLFSMTGLHKCKLSNLPSKCSYLIMEFYVFKSEGFVKMVFTWLTESSLSWACFLLLIVHFLEFMSSPLLNSTIVCLDSWHREWLVIALLDVTGTIMLLSW